MGYRYSGCPGSPESPGGAGREGRRALAGGTDTVTAIVDGPAGRFHNEDLIDFRSWPWIHD
jgi:hypothetical protein